MNQKGTLVLFGILLFSIFSFKNLRIESVIGKYHFEMDFKYIELIINSDSTFRISDTDRSWAKSGSWHTNHDTLILNYQKLDCTSNKCASELDDTLHLYKKYIIKENYLYPAHNYKKIKKGRWFSAMYSFERDFGQNGVIESYFYTDSANYKIQKTWENDTLISTDTVIIKRTK
ncbi:MAG: hypothetical protein H7Z76_11870 [Methylotenera sp.]|nr:hypothetical protein [Flavobacterium sp.]